jgi:MoxR-like ATPase
VARVADNVERALRGKREVVDLCLAALLARGHLLIEDVPGVGKTTLAQALARSLGLSFARVQFTSDLLPSDILGVSIFDARSGAFEFKPGPIFANVVLADEINRTTPRTQSCLLEAMSEAQVSLDGTTRHLPRPFWVMATQNPREHAGTYPLPESQLDRFLMRLSIGYPPAEVERQILRGRGEEEPVHALGPVVTAEELAGMQAAVPHVRMDEAVSDYLMRLVEATRSTPLLHLGVSTRGALSLYRCAQARALAQGRDFVIPEDVKSLAVSCLAHRVVPAGRAAEEMDRSEADRVIADLADRVPVPE